MCRFMKHSFNQINYRKTKTRQTMSGKVNCRVSVWPTNKSKQFVPLNIIISRLFIAISVCSTSTCEGNHSCRFSWFPESMMYQSHVKCFVHDWDVYLDTGSVRSFEICFVMCHAHASFYFLKLFISKHIFSERSSTHAYN